MRWLCAVVVIGGALAARPAGAQADGAPGGAAARMAQPGPEQRALRRAAGTWDAVATMWPSEGAEPVVTRGLVAERTMIGSILQEVLRPAAGSAGADFQRIDYLDFDRVEGRWKYVSMDTRFPVSIMPAASFGRARAGAITLQFAPQAFVGFGGTVEGRFLLCELEISQPDPDHEIKRQRCSLATGDGAAWRFVEYAYTRRR